MPIQQTFFSLKKFEKEKVSIGFDPNCLCLFNFNRSSYINVKRREKTAAAIVFCFFFLQAIELTINAHRGNSDHNRRAPNVWSKRFNYVYYNCSGIILLI